MFFEIDNRTLALVSLLVAVLNTGLLTLLFGRRRQYPGQGYWILGNVTYTISLILLMLQGHADQFLTIVLANVLCVAAMTIFYGGLQLFVYGATRPVVLALYPLLTMGLFVYLTYVHFDTPARIIVLSLILTLISINSGLTMLNRKYWPLPPRYYSGTVVFFVIAGFLVLRAGLTLAHPQIRSLFDPNAVASATFIMSILANICWTAVFLYIVSARIGQERLHLIDDLQQALSEVKKLEGFIPICSNCKKIRDDQGYWQQVEQYVSARSGAQFSHGICPDCIKKLYPGFDDIETD